MAAATLRKIVDSPGSRLTTALNSCYATHAPEFRCQAFELQLLFSFPLRVS
jgi:hypothetical protein